MKLYMPWFYLAAVTVAHINIADAQGSPHRSGKHVTKAKVNKADQNVAGQINDTILYYRKGQYFKALETFSKQPSYNAVGAYYLGRMNLYGYGQLKNNAKAIRYFSEAAEGGFLPAQELMALYMLLEKKDPAGAFYWYKKAADADDVKAQMYVAAAY